MARQISSMGGDGQSGRSRSGGYLAEQAGRGTTTAKRFTRRNDGGHEAQRFVESEVRNCLDVGLGFVPRDALIDEVVEGRACVAVADNSRLGRERAP